MKCHFCSVFLFFLFVPLPLPLPGQWSFSSNLTVWRREAFPGEETALPCWSSELGKELHWLSHLGTFSPSCPPSPNPGCSRRMALRCSAVVWRQTLRGSWSSASAGSNAWILSLLFLSSWVGLCWQPRWLAKSHGHHHPSRLAKVPATPSGVCSCSLLRHAGRRGGDGAVSAPPCQADARAWRSCK